MNKLAGILLVTLFCLSMGAHEAKLEITRLARDIYLKGKFVRISYDIEMVNNGPVATKKYLHLVHSNYTNKLIEVLAFTPGYVELIIAKLPSSVGNNSASYQVDLPYAMQVGAKMSIRVLELYKNRLVPKPEKLPLSSVIIMLLRYQDEQKVEFIDNIYTFSAYPIKSQETILSIPSLKKIEYYTERESTKNEKAKSIKYGPLYGAYKDEELRIHYELPIPLIHFPVVERQIELSHLGSIAITEHYELKNDAAALDGEFNRVKYTSLTNYQQGGHIFRKLFAQLPRKAYNLYYRDVIGNVSTSVATREVAS